MEGAVGKSGRCLPERDFLLREHIELENQMGRVEFIYLAKLGGDHTAFASFQPHRQPQMEDEKCGTSALVQAGSVVSPISTRGSTALSYRGGIRVAQTPWWESRHVSWARHPLMIPAVATVAILGGHDPSMLEDLFILVGHAVGRYISHWVFRMSQTWLCDPWIWRIPFIFVLSGSP